MINTEASMNCKEDEPYIWNWLALYACIVYKRLPTRNALTVLKEIGDNSM
jgi:hypothetical protein